MERKNDSNMGTANEDVRTLCDKCARDYYNSPDFYIKAVYPRTDKESCTKCDGKGYDYIVRDKSKNNSW